MKTNRNAIFVFTELDRGQEHETPNHFINQLMPLKSLEDTLHS